ncbi:MAG TPA: hypothetical protein PK958_16835 [Rhodocyclaceae bacterium]|uniref:hypothetical protein n=1 Tax=Accumulibacter sp. TaxID=2053492 RepID=UPI002CF3A8D5|nr:hypothetical protein [Accumulibacter sp.]HNI00619.1 hypothetical protein [Rhodocyclaceae bacterium]HNL98561.1 hypothetical protein [Accumulibacter sp.]
MAFTNSNDYISGRLPVPTPAGPEVLSTRFTLSMATADAALNTIGQIGILPAGCIPIDVRVDMTDPDAGTAAMVLQVGIWDGSGSSLSTDSADGGAHWGTTTAVTAASSQSLTRNGVAMESVTKSSSDRKLGVKVTTAPTTAQAFTLGVTLLYKAA